MTHSRSSLFDRLRASPLLRAWLLVLALASALGGLHVASHAGATPGSAASDLPAGGGDDPGTSRHGDCPVCRLAVHWALALPVLLLWALATPTVVALPRARRAPSRQDVAARWRLRRKQGPPSSR
jgi:hypothetical protein